MLDLPSLPIPLKEYIPYLQQQSRDSILSGEALKPFRAYESRLREIFAQEPDNPVLSDPHVNVVPVFSDRNDALMIKARDLDKEVPAQVDKYILPLGPKLRRPDGSPATVGSIDEFKNNFRLFSESSLVDLDWSNILVAGSAVTTCLLPIPPEYNHSKKAQRSYYHELIAPASDVDLFIYGLNEEQAVEKMKQIERCVADSILEETTVIRTKNAVTIASKYPTRHVQIVLRLYQNISELVTGFDIDCACTLFDGSQVWANPRALASFVTQANVIDLTRRSPSYENRLAKYAHRGFEVYWGDMDRSRVDPTVFERSFSHVVGLARLLVMEKLPTAEARDAYISERRAERKRPHRQSQYQGDWGNIKESQPEDVAEWVDEEEVSNYHTFMVPYGPKYNAKKIERILYQKDLLLNAEWNRSDEREVNLHRHPAFFGNTEHVVEDCCGFCPVPITDEEISVAEDESKKFVSGRIRFLKDNPGRQAIGSFNPITDSDWTEMAYVGNTARLCQAIVDRDLETVQKCCLMEDFDIDQRDHTGRMPLHLAIMCSTPAIVECLINHGARLVSRIAGGFTSLHLSAARGDVAIIKAILEKSHANKADNLEDFSKKSTALQNKNSSENGTDSDSDDSDISKVDAETDIQDATTEGSIINIETPAAPENTDEVEAGNNEPNFYDSVDVISWDFPITPAQLAIIMGHNAAVETLGDWGADMSKPVNYKDFMYGIDTRAVLTLALALNHPPGVANPLMKSLLEFGASSTQASHRHVTAFHVAVAAGEPSYIDLLYQLDAPAARIAIDHPAFVNHYYNRALQLPLVTAIRHRGFPMVTKLLEHGVELSSSTERLRQFCARQDKVRGNERTPLKNPLLQAVENASPEVVRFLLDAGADPNSMSAASYEALKLRNEEFKCHTHLKSGQTALDLLNSRIQKAEAKIKDQSRKPLMLSAPELEPDSVYLGELAEGSYEHWFTKNEVLISKWIVEAIPIGNDKRLQNFHSGQISGLEDEVNDLKNLRAVFVEKGAKTFDELSPTPPDENTPQTYTKPAPAPKTDPQTFAVSCTFKSIDKRDTLPSYYLQLFQAAWEGDMHKFKSLTLGSWGPNKEHPPLQVAVRDEKRFTPFTVATYRGHYELASLILEIAEAQYLPVEQHPTRKSYQVLVNVESDGEDTFNSSNDNSLDGVRLGVRYELADEYFTIDDIREVANIVKSTVSPSDLINKMSDLRLCLDNAKSSFMAEAIRTCSVDFWAENSWGAFKSIYQRCSHDGYNLLNYAVETGNLDMVKFLVKMRELWDEHTYDSKKDASSYLFLDLKGSCLQAASKRGHVEIVAFLMARTGAGLPFKKITQDIETKIETEPKYYRGLSVYGKKRKDWANQDDYRPNLHQENTLFLRSLAFHDFETAKWLVSDEPERKYIEFINNFKDDPRLKAFHMVEGGFEHIISAWIKKKRELAVHCAVLSTDKDSQQKIELALKCAPGSLHAKNCEGYTPLIVAASLRRPQAMAILIEAGADVNSRDSAGRNALHHLLVNRDGFASPEEIREMSDILGLDVVRRLAIQKSYPKVGFFSQGWGCLTPLAGCLDEKSVNVSKKHINRGSLKALLEITSGQDLYVMDGKGNYPIHHVVENLHVDLVYTMLEFDPSLAITENATGATPLDLAESIYLNKMLSHAANMTESPNNISDNKSKTYDQSLTRRYDFLNSEPYWEPSSALSPWSTAHLPETAILYMLRSFASRTSVNRKLVSVDDARLLSKRINADRWRSELEKEEEPSDNIKKDEVSLWMQQM